VRVLRGSVLEGKKVEENIGEKHGTLVHSFGEIRMLQQMLLVLC